MRSSDSIAQLACALAKAQIELVNPPKSLTGRLEVGRNAAGGQTFRYARLSAAVEAARKTLGKHELAVMQTTQLDQQSGALMLTSTLAHSSGEWIASSWPVCGRAEMHHPKLMGAALTYARRYSLFALIGLAGEDDLDAPESLGGAGASPLQETEACALPTAESGILHDGPHPPPSSIPAQGLDTPPIIGSGRPGKTLAGAPTNRSASELTRDLEALQTADEVMQWALDALPSRNRMTPAERAALDAAFATRAKHVSADPNLLLAFNQNPRRRRRRRGASLVPTGPVSPAQEAAHAPQAAI